MELHYELTVDDHKAMVRQQTARFRKAAKSPQSTIALAAIILGGGLLVGRLYPRHGLGSPDQLLGLLWFGVLLVAVAVSIVIRRSATGRALDQVFGGGMTAIDVHLALRPDGIAGESSASSGLTYWRAVKSIEDTGDYVVVRTGIAGELIIPKRAFQDAQHMQVFLGELQRLWHASASTPAAP
jgi:hypothetical protein